MSIFNERWLVTFDGGLEAVFNNSALAFIKGTELHMTAFIQT